MPILIGHMIGKAIGNVIVSILSIVFRILYLLGVVAFRLLGVVFRMFAWFFGVMWDGGRDLYKDYKLNCK